MYLYGFTTFAGIDKVMKLDRCDLGFSCGDLLKSDDEYFLVLGDDVSFAEQYLSRFPVGRELQLVYPGFFSLNHIKWIHWMVAEYYSSYRNVMRYFISQDVQSVLDKESQKKPKGLSKLCLSPDSFGVSSLAEKGQTLIVYPDLWTMFMMTTELIRSHQAVLLLHSSDTQVKKDKAFWQVKNGLVKYILVTHAELFHDFHNLQQIVLIDSYKRYYANQQDPRYKTPDVLEYLADLWKIKLLDE